MRQRITMTLMMLGLSMGFVFFGTQNISAAEKIVFMSDRDGNYEIYVMNANGTNQTRLTNNRSKDLQPSWGGHRRR